jgi:HK97 gp10 family phage protein|tara:strand:+ start:292 stop:729 length:438 start_codon:yes stop_codon:yes gene_type:complete
MTGFKNVAAFKKKLKKRLEKDASGNIKTAMVRSTNAVRDKVISSISRTGTGNERPPPKKGRASAAGQPPATDSGVLRSNISTNLVVEKNALIGQIIAYAPRKNGNYALDLEFGTRNMEARPFMQPALNDSAKKISSIFKEEGVIQ